MPNDYKHVHKQRQESGEAKSGGGKIVIEGIDEPKPPAPRPTVMDPWSNDYPYRAGHGEQVKST